MEIEGKVDGKGNNVKQKFGIEGGKRAWK